METVPSGALRVFGVTLIGATAENGRKLLLTIVFVAVVLAAAWLGRLALRAIAHWWNHPRFEFWGRQVLNILTALVLSAGVLSIWFNDPTRLTTALGLFTAGIAFALQRVITATAGYFVILRGKTFTLGDRIVMGGVRGDVIALSFMQTTIMEMGQPPGEQGDEPSMWVKSRQYTGRIVTISNAKIFDEPVYNYSREFPFLWEEMSIPVRYGDDRKKVESILLETARKYTFDIEKMSDEDRHELRRRYAMPVTKTEPKVYWRLTDNWVELTVRFLVGTHGIRDIKDKMSREILEKLDAAKIGIGSSTFEIVGIPPLVITPAKTSEHSSA